MLFVSLLPVRSSCRNEACSRRAFGWAEVNILAGDLSGGTRISARSASVPRNLTYRGSFDQARGLLALYSRLCPHGT